MDDAPFLTIRNAHGESSGTPPRFESGLGYLSYFESDTGDQWVFARDRTSGVFFVAGGDLGWEHHIVGERAIRGLVLGIAERLWVLACLHGCGLQLVAERVAGAWEDSS